MQQKEILLRNLMFARQRSMAVWEAIPEKFYFWKPDPDAMHLLESVRHIFEVQLWFYQLIISKGDVSKIKMPEENKNYTNLEDEIKKGEKYTTLLKDFIQICKEEDFDKYIIDRTDKVFKMTLGDFLLRAAYHEATHTGQILAYLRTLNIDRPNIWDLSAA